MSAEVVEGPAGLFVVTGNPDTGYDVRPVGPPIASYKRKYLACHEVKTGAVHAAGDHE